MEIIESFLHQVTTEYGLFATFQFLAIIALGVLLRTVWKKSLKQDEYIQEQAEKMMDVVINNTKVITQIVEKLEKH